MKKRENFARNIFWTIIMIVALIALVKGYQKYNYNDFVKNINKRNITHFTRDKEVTYGKNSSYKIESTDYNDAMFYQTIRVTPNTAYKVTCKIKTQDVINEKTKMNGGAHISLAGTTLSSMPIAGTNDWQEATLLFNSQNHTEVKIGFRLGGYEDNSKGTAWFSDLKVEQGVTSNGNTWKFACFIFPKIEVDVNVNGKMEHVSMTMTDSDVQDIKTNMKRFQSSIRIMSQNKMRIEYDVITINEPITNLSYDDENGYYVSPNDIYALTRQYVEENEYDHIYVAIRMADMQKGNNTLSNDWIGLGGMDYLGIGYSNIRLPDDEKNYIYKFNYNYNTFPEEVFIHEFLHTLERNAKEYGYENPALHDYSKYGYSEEKLTGLKKWYEDYMNCNISFQGKKIGLPAEIFTYRPVHEGNFKYSYELDVMKEPENVIEIIKSLFKRVGNLFSYFKNKEETDF